MKIYGGSRDGTNICNGGTSLDSMRTHRYPNIANAFEAEASKDVSYIGASTSDVNKVGKYRLCKVHVLCNHSTSFLLTPAALVCTRKGYGSSIGRRALKHVSVSRDLSSIVSSSLTDMR